MQSHGILLHSNLFGTFKLWTVLSQEKIYFSLFQVLKMMVGNNLKDTQLQQIVDKTIVFADKDEDGKISFDEFCSVVGNTDIHKKMVVDV